MKKIGVLTQPLGHNYGGFLQAYALQTVLKRMGHDTKVVDIRKEESAQSWRFMLKQLVKRFLNVILIGFLKEPFLINPSKEDYDKIYRKNNHFLAKHVERTRRYDLIKSYLDLKEYHFDVFIVGSDQVWRPEYSVNMPNFFLDFLEGIQGVKRVSYAASFGVDDLSFSSENISSYSKLLKTFDAVSVRENSGVAICDEKFGVNATLVLDPTLLLNAYDYEKLIEEDERIVKLSNSLMCYVLDGSKEKDIIISKLSSELGLVPNIIHPKKEYDRLGQLDVEKSRYPSVTSWLSGFRDAEFVITDSFHGMVFSIMFNKQFLVIGNKDRGLSRFTSLLKILQLERRLICSLEDFDFSVVDDNIDYQLVSNIINAEREKSFDFLVGAVG